MELEGIMLSEISQTGKTNTFYMWNLKKEKITSLQIQRTDEWLPKVKVGQGKWEKWRKGIKKVNN